MKKILFIFGIIFINVIMSDKIYALAEIETSDISKIPIETAGKSWEYTINNHLYKILIPQNNNQFWIYKDGTKISGIGGYTNVINFNFLIGYNDRCVWIFTKNTSLADKTNGTPAFYTLKYGKEYITVNNDNIELIANNFWSNINSYMKLEVGTESSPMMTGISNEGTSAGSCNFNEGYIKNAGLKLIGSNINFALLKDATSVDVSNIENLYDFNIEPEPIPVDPNEDLTSWFNHIKNKIEVIINFILDNKILTLFMGITFIMFIITILRRLIK